MKVNYVLLYGTPYLKYELFDTFEKMSDFIIKRSLVNYTIFEKMEDKKEVEMIYRDNDIRVLEKENELLKDKIDKIKVIYTSMQFSAPENMYIFIEKLGNILRGKDNGTR